VALGDNPGGAGRCDSFRQGQWHWYGLRGSELQRCWQYSPIYTIKDGPLPKTASASYTTGIVPQFDTYYVAHIDSDTLNGVSAPKVRLTSYSIFTTLTTTIVGQSSNSLLASVATVVAGGKLYIFYSSPNGAVDTLNVTTYDGSKFATCILDRIAWPNGQVDANMYMPAAVAAPDGIRVYYHDNSHGTLREAHSADFVHWPDFTVVDGPGGVSRADPNPVGWWPSAVVYGTTVNVFYTDFLNQTLRIAQRANGVWTSNCIDALCAEKIDTNSLKATVVYDNAMQVYYFSGGKLREASGRTPGAFGLATIDGDPGYGPPIMTTVGAVSDQMQENVTAVEVNGTAPGVFYWDAQHPKLRDAYWK
jgi:hypothetical protein